MNVHDFETIDCSEVTGVCSHYAEWAKERLGRGEVWGFYDWDNPNTEPGQLAGGHDFLLVERRWIIDLWCKHVAGITNRVVFDLRAASDREEITRLFGNQLKWEYVTG